MGNIWDLPGASHPVRGKRKSRRQRKQRREPEEQMPLGVNQIVKTASDFTMGAMGIAVMSNLGSQVISGLAKK